MEVHAQSGNPELDQQIRNWLKWDKEESKSHNAVLDMIRNQQWSLLDSIMTNRVTFGTAGIRGIMEPGFNRMNDLIIIQTTQGLAHYTLHSYPQIKTVGVVIGFDARFNSSRWASLAAGVFLRLGIKVWLFSKVTPTPFVPFTVKCKQAALGIMITASHNPKDDNGYKVYWHNGAQITPPHDKNIHACILEHLPPESDKSFDEEDIWPYRGGLLMDPLHEMCDSYFSMLKDSMHDIDRNQRLRKRITYTAMHGVGATYIDTAFQVAGFQPVIHVEEQRDPDPNFPTVPFPNPEEGKSALNLAMASVERYMKENQQTIEQGINGPCLHILANDPDADRLAVAEFSPSMGKWQILNGNQIGALLGWWQFYTYMDQHGSHVDKSKLYFIASTVSSKLLRSIALHEGLAFEETLTGFKWMANRAYELESQQGAQILLAYEEAIGFMCGTSVLDKDGISAAVRVAELIAFLDSKNMSLLDKLNDLYNQYGYHCSHNSYYKNDKPEVTEAIFGRLRNFDEGRSNSYPIIIGDKYTVSNVRDLTTGYDSSKPDHKAVLPTDPKTQMITFQFDNGIVATLRTSGTEPKLKYYVEYCAGPQHKNWALLEEELHQFVRVFVEETIQPDKYGLKPQD